MFSTIYFLTSYKLRLLIFLCSIVFFKNIFLMRLIFFGFSRHERCIKLCYLCVFLYGYSLVHCRFLFLCITSCSLVIKARIFLCICNSTKYKNIFSNIVFVHYYMCCNKTLIFNILLFNNHISHFNLVYDCVGKLDKFKVVFTVKYFSRQLKNHYTNRLHLFTFYINIQLSSVYTIKNRISTYKND